MKAPHGRKGYEEWIREQFAEIDIGEDWSTEEYPVSDCSRGVPCRVDVRKVQARLMSEYPMTQAIDYEVIVSAVVRVGKHDEREVEERIKSMTFDYAVDRATDVVWRLVSDGEM